jgi:hypothetical protein
MICTVPCRILAVVLLLLLLLLLQARFTDGFHHSLTWPGSAALHLTPAAGLRSSSACYIA